MPNEESDFASLKTICSFDKGEDSTLAINLDCNGHQGFSPSSLLVESLIEQLCKLLEKDPKKWKTLYLSICEKLHNMRLIDDSYEREEFEFMRTYYQKALYQLVTVAKSTSIDKALITPQINDSVKVSSEGIIQWSRYSNEFEELEYIAKGGFGQVYKAQHKLDGGIYAVKKIYLRYHNVNDFLQYLREVKMLAKLHHPNIVAYKAAWLEPFNRKKKIVHAIEMSEETQEEDSLEVVFESSQKKSASDEILSDRAVVCSSSTTDKNMFKYEVDFDDIPSIPDWAILYIQMQLCQQTLRQWLDMRNSESSLINIDECIDIFTKVVRGVEYIHSQGIIHHDIKPSNIFISQDLNHVQVGDFGLACSLLSHQSPLSLITTHQPGNVGTKLYAAPEQLRGHCHPKSDVYSLGIILVELVVPFNTAMERSKVISQLKSGHIPSALLSSYPHISKLVADTVCNSVKKRPTSSELLTKLDESERVRTQRVLARQNETIMRLRKESLEKDEEIASLREELQQLKLQRITNFE